MVQALVKFRFVFGKIGDARNVDGNNADRAGAFAAAEEAAGFLAQFAHIQTQTATHRTDVAGLHIAVDIVREIRRAVFGGHFKQQLVVFGFGPVEIFGDGIGRNRLLETAAVGVAFDHDFV